MRLFCSWSAVAGYVDFCCFAFRAIQSKNQALKGKVIVEITSAWVGLKTKEIQRVIHPYFFNKKPFKPI